MSQKIILPIILATVAVISGLFAFTPIQEATTVHLTIIDDSVRILTADNQIIDDGGLDLICTITASGGVVLVQDILIDNTDTSNGVDHSIALVDLKLNGSDLANGADGFEIAGLDNIDTIASLWSMIEQQTGGGQGTIVLHDVLLDDGQTLVFTLDNDDDDNDNEQTVDISVLVDGNSSTSLNCVEEEV